MKTSILLQAITILSSTVFALPGLAFSRATPEPGWPSCQRLLNCTFRQIVSAPLPERITFLDYMQTQHFTALNAASQYGAIKGVLNFFVKNNLGTPEESWVSYVDAGIIEGIQRGGARALGLESARWATEGDGSSEWEAFLVGMRDGKWKDRDTHDRAWATGEQAATEYGVQLADSKFTRTARERNWFLFSQLFRWIMRNRKATNIALSVTIVGGLAVEFVDWLTDVTNPQPAECFSEIAWFFAGQADGDPSNNFKDLILITPRLYECFKKDTKRQ